jgi:hypothetical protein
MASPRTADQVLDLLTDIAETGSADPAPVVRDLSWTGHTPESLTAAWLEFRSGVRAVAAMLAGAKSWVEFYDYPQTANLEEAVQRKMAEVDDAYRVLVDGPAGSRA